MSFSSLKTAAKTVIVLETTETAVNTAVVTPANEMIVKIGGIATVNAVTENLTLAEIVVTGKVIEEIVVTTGMEGRGNKNLAALDDLERSTSIHLEMEGIDGLDMKTSMLLRRLGDDHQGWLLVR